MTPAAERQARRGLTLALAAYGVFLLMQPGHYSWLDSVDLAIHETGHLLFTPFGELMHMLGGTVFQLMLPAAFVVSFARRGDRHAASVALWWVAQNLWNVSVYVGDAQAQQLPLVGGGEHDWAYLLERFDVLRYDRGISAVVRVVGAAVFGTAVFWGLATAGRGRAPNAAC